MLLIKYAAYALIVIGCLFTTGAIIIMFMNDNWSDFLLGWILFGPLPLILGFLTLWYLKTKINLTIINKFK